MAQGKSTGKPIRIEPDLEFIREIKLAGGDTVKKCYQCATCSTVCPISPEDGPFPRKEMIWASWGLKERLVTDPDIWLCYQCNDCSVYCPRGANPGDVLAAVRKRAFEWYAIPRGLGKAVGSPGGLIPLLLVPVILVGLILWKGAAYNDAFPEALRHTSWYGEFFPLLAVDTLFIVTVLLMGGLMIASLTRFWKDMVAGMPGPEKKTFVQATIDTIIEILRHDRFDQCETAKPRRMGHMLTFWGMILLFLTTACVFIGLYFFEMHIPMAPWFPVKILGIVGAVVFCAGLFMLWNTRLNDPDSAGKSSYQDMLFLWVLVIVGLTGVGAYLLRVVSPDAVNPTAEANQASAIPTIAVAVYFVHLVSVWFLLAYLPYSKFAHMVYRTFALIRAHQVDRWRPLSEKPATVPTEATVEGSESEEKSEDGEDKDDEDKDDEDKDGEDEEDDKDEK